MICVVDKNNKIINIINADSPTRENERICYPWNSLWEQYTDVEPLEYAKPAKIAELKAERDSKEVEPITYNGNSYDYDGKARERINAAIIALDVQGADASIDWTTADNQDVKVTADDLRCVIAAVAQRSNALHVAYRAAKDKVEQATTVAEVEAVTLNL